MSARREAVIGNADNFWLYSADVGFDLSHPPALGQTAPSTIRIETSTSPITFDPAKSALVIIDMQNYFLSPLLDRKRGRGHEAAEQLVGHAIPAARKADMRIIWLNWGLTDQDIAEMPPAVTRAFGFETMVSPRHEEALRDRGTGAPLDRLGRPLLPGVHRYRGLGSNTDPIQDPSTGNDVDPGRLLMRDTWNAALFPPLDRAYEEGKGKAVRPDVWLHKNRMSGMWGASGECEEFLKRERIQTLFFAGVNTDQCVGGTYQDCFSKGYDCVLLQDGCGTTSPSAAQQCIEFNASNVWGFLTTCKSFAEGIAASVR